MNALRCTKSYHALAVRAESTDEAKWKGTNEKRMARFILSIYPTPAHSRSLAMLSHTTANMGDNGKDEEKSDGLFLLWVEGVSRSRGCLMAALRQEKAQRRMENMEMRRERKSFVFIKTDRRIACNTTTTTTPLKLFHFYNHRVYSFL